MHSNEQQNQFYIGWDVGGWNCDKNPNSRDAIVILDGQCQLVGSAWRGNLRRIINQAKTTQQFVTALFNLCDVELTTDGHVTLGIDTPLAFSDGFVQLLTKGHAAEGIGNSSTNPYLYRYTERYLFEHGITPLSPVKDMIGSQATKGIHVLARFAPQQHGCGVWSDGRYLKAIEAYPSPCKRSQAMQLLRQRYPDLGSADCNDALLCALLAYLHGCQPQLLLPPTEEVPLSEGWIWIPADAVV